MTEPIKNRYEFVILYDVENGNPNGDPDADNMPRIDPETRLGLVTDVCLKRKIRNYVQTIKENQPGFRIYIQDEMPLNALDSQAYLALEVLNEEDLSAFFGKDKDKKNKSKDEKDDKVGAKIKAAVKNDPSLDAKLGEWMCKNFYDIRTFGAVMTGFVSSKAGLHCGQMRGPVQLGFSRSVEPILPQEITITRIAVTKAKDAEVKSNTMGHKFTIPYGLYRCEGYVSANLARKSTGFSEEDLELLWEAIINMFEHDHSAARGNMAVRDLIIFKHESELGNAPAHKLFDLVKIARKTESNTPARSYQDYDVTVDEANLPSGVTCIRK